MVDNSQKVYYATQGSRQVYVEVLDGDSPDNIYALPDGTQHVNHSPTGFSWGYGGSGPAQLAFAVLLDFLSDCPGIDFAVEIARSHYQSFKWDKIAPMNFGGEFNLTGREVADWLESQTEVEGVSPCRSNHKTNGNGTGPGT